MHDKLAQRTGGISNYTSTRLHAFSVKSVIQISAKRRGPGFVICVPAVAYHFYRSCLQHLRNPGHTLWPSPVLGPNLILVRGLVKYVPAVAILFLVLPG